MGSSQKADLQPGWLPVSFNQVSPFKPTKRRFLWLQNWRPKWDLGIRSRSHRPTVTLSSQYRFTAPLLQMKVSVPAPLPVIDRADVEGKPMPTHVSEV